MPSGFSGKVQITGWFVGNFFEEERASNYSTNFGANQFIYAASVYSNYRFGVTLSRGAAVYILKLLPPFGITLFITGIVFLMDVEALDVRIATSVGGLLTLVFLQLQFSAQLPPAINYLTLMDWVFNLGFFLTVITVIECIVIRRLYYRLIDKTETLKAHLELTQFFFRQESELPTVEPVDRSSTMSEDEKVIGKKMEDMQLRKEKIKRIVWSLERVFFICYVVFGSVMLFIITMAINFS